jgi:hypothetical protein
MTSIRSYLIEQSKNKTNPLKFYVYAYIRSKDSATAKAGTPYYIGKGTGNRAWDKHTFPIPNNSRIIILETGLTELGSLALERRLIAWWGRKDLKTGILYNLTSGGDGVSDISEEHRLRLSKSHLGKRHTDETKSKMSKVHKGQYRNQESRAKISAANKGRKHSAEQNLKNSERCKGRIVSEETKTKLSILKKGRKQSVEQNTKISKSKKLFYYVSPIGIVDNAADLVPIISASAILHWCNNPNKIISKKIYSSSKYLYTNYTIDIIGRTFDELGFYKIKKELFSLIKF